jgi:hypothetical protein
MNSNFITFYDSNHSLRSISVDNIEKKDINFSKEVRKNFLLMGRAESISA